VRQEINLLPNKEGAIKPKVSFVLSFVVSVAFVGCLVALTWAYSRQLLSINQDIAAIEKNNLSQQNKVVDTGVIKKSQTQLKSLEKQLVSRYQLWINYKKITEAGKDGFSKHFYHLANLADKNLSLYEIEIYDRGNSLALKGYARKAEYIPIYINSLKKENEFKKVTFGDLSIEKIKGHNVMRFALERKEDESAKEDKNVEKPIDISELIKTMTLSDVRSRSESELAVNVEGDQ
jgi:hypothetical protein